jgi:hypothetical protein
MWLNFRFACIMTSLLLACASAVAKEEAEEIELFNGRDLEGWGYELSEPDVAMEDVWSVKDGVLVCKGRPAGYIVTKRDDFSDYVLTLDWRWTGKPGNNGVLIHSSTPKTLGIWPKSLEVQLGSGDAGDFWVIGTTIDIEDAEKRRTDRRHLNLTDGSEKKPGEWNTMEIIADGDEVTVKVNDELVNHCTNSSVTKGAIALQSEGAPIEYRDIKLRPRRRSSSHDETRKVFCPQMTQMVADSTISSAYLWLSAKSADDNSSLIATANGR